MTVDQILIPDSEPDAWNEALEGLIYGPGHTHFYNAAVAKTYKSRVFLYSFCGAQGAKVAVPLIEREFNGTRDMFSPYGNNGFLATGRCDGFWDEHRDFMQAQGYVCSHISLNQIEPCETIVPAHTVEALKPVYVVDTTQDETSLWKSFGRNNRRHLNRWRENEQVEIVHDAEQLGAAFMALYPVFAERMNVSDRQRLSNQTLSEIMTRDENVKLIGVRENDGKISFVRCFLFTSSSAEAFLEASTEEGRRHSRAIYWQAYLWARQAGIDTLNLSGGIKAGDSLEFFKKSLGGVRRTLYRARLVYNETLYDKMCDAAGVSGKLEAGRFFPPYMESTQ